MATIVRLANFVAPTSGGIRTYLDATADGYRAVARGGLGTDAVARTRRRRIPACDAPGAPDSPSPDPGQ